MKLFARGLGLAVVALAGAGPMSTARASLEPPMESASEPAGEEEVEVEEPEVEEPEVEEPWTFERPERPVKVVVLAGSIGAFPGRSYARRLARMCRRIEVHNLSKVGLGSYALERRFVEQVLKNPLLDLASGEHWLVFGGGLNSVGSPHKSNHHARRLFERAHQAGMKVVGLSVTPWGSNEDARFAGAGGLRRFEATKRVADFVLKRLQPVEALGKRAGRRSAGRKAQWRPEELPDISVDLLDSPLRDADAEPRDLDETREAIRADRRWLREHADLEPSVKALALEADTIRASQLPRWFLAPELRSFDHIHPNAEGHAIIAATICPKLPEQWDCECPPPPEKP